MKLTKVQQEILDDLMMILAKQGRPSTFGWALGTIISIAQYDPQLRRRLRKKSGRDR